MGDGARNLCLSAQRCGADGRCQGRFHLSARITPQTFLETVGPFRRWQRAPTFLASQTPLTWPFGVTLTSLEGAQGFRGRARSGFGGPDLEKECESREGPSASFLSPGCQAATAAAGPRSPVPPQLPWRGGGARGQPCAERLPGPPQLAREAR